MIPIRDTIQARNYPVVNTAIIALNVFFYFVELAQGPRLHQFIFTYGLVPARYSTDIGNYFSVGQQVLSFFSFMFIHGGFWHLLGNMWSLYIFGDNVEDRLGPIKYLFFYILCGLGSGLSHLLLNWHSQVPTIGASGAIAGVMGAYLILFPGSRILTLIPIFFIPYFVEIPALVFLGIWFLLQFLSAASAPAQAGGIAWWAHVGGFLFGMLLLKIFLWVPEPSFVSRVTSLASTRKAPRLQLIRTRRESAEADLFGTITITPAEARLGARKLVNIPYGFRSRILRVNVPPGVRDGMILRLAGLGRDLPGGRRGDLYLKVRIHSWDE
ncbi:MAG: rhomboid family intramembrane serine protease [Deltaproteobacteria bacterium]|nr:rhomboid family intramembrane serine protease [Deltaproteobacteria bacterium]